MGYYAKVEDDIVTQVIVSDNTPEISGEWIETRKDGSIRGCYAGIDFHYDRVKDIFYPFSPYPSWTLNETGYYWEPPVAYPADGTHEKQYYWDEDTTAWVEITE